MLIRNSNYYTKTYIVPVLVMMVLTITLFPLTARADDKELQDIKEQQLKLKQLVDQISKLQDERKEQKAKLEKLNTQMQCNWTLLKAYDACEKDNRDNLQVQIDCKLKAKNEAKNCLSSIEDN
jgi:cell division protein FtsB